MWAKRINRRRSIALACFVTIACLCADSARSQSQIEFVGETLIDDSFVVRANDWGHSNDQHFSESDYNFGELHYDHEFRESKLRVSSSDPNDPRRHVGYGVPLTNTSWLNRPLHADVFIGSIFGDELIRNRVNQRGGLLSGVRLGIDFDHFWGSEIRFATSHPNLETGGQATIQFFDAHLLYYPWGDARWRPYVTVGSGLARYSFVSDTGQSIGQVMYHLPVGAGMKYFFSKTFALRMEFRNNIAFGRASVSTLHNLSLTSSFEWRFGGKRRSYFPYDAGRRDW